jgi:transketolase
VGICERNNQSDTLKEKARWVRRQTINIHAIAPETRLASSLSAVELFVALYYGEILRFDPREPRWAGRDRLVISKGHGSISLYPILADLGFFELAELGRVCKEGSFLGGIPDTQIPGYETINGSLGHGLGVSCGTALALRANGSNAHVFVLIGDGELYEGSVWEAIMFAAHHHIGNLTAIIDYNKISMLDYCSNILDISPLKEKFSVFGWRVETVDGHDLDALPVVLNDLRNDPCGPKVLIANTVKGKGVGCLENDSLCHIKSLSESNILDVLKDYP